MMTTTEIIAFTLHLSRLLGTFLDTVFYGWRSAESKTMECCITVIFHKCCAC